MKFNSKSITFGAVIGAILASNIAAFASSGTQSIDVVFKNIKIWANGSLVIPKDANGKELEPFIYNGTTYLPVRAVGEAVGQEVSWDGASSTVYVGGNPNVQKDFMDICKPYEYSYGKEYLKTDGETFTMSGNKYASGFTMRSGISCVLFNTNAQYGALTIDIGHIDGTSSYKAKLSVFLDGNFEQEYTLEPDTGVKRISIPLKYANNVKLQLSDGAYQSLYGFANGVFS